MSISIKYESFISGFKPPGKGGKSASSSSQDHLTRSDVTNQGRVLMTQFIRDRMRADGYTESTPTDDDLIPMGTPTGR